jgi:aryl-alcohol dehydrogenase-like predicted oxidoreductase
MRERRLGRTGRSVGQIGLGAMPLSLARRPDEATALRVIHAALELGVTLIDTADVYCEGEGDLGHNERLIARALRELPQGARAAVVVATKGGLERPGGDWVSNGRPEHLRVACEASLRALGVERIELYQLHAPDPGVPFAESVGALAELQREGKVHHLGLSNVGLRELELAEAQIEVASVQNRCSPFDTTSFRNGVIRYCEERGIAFLPWGPVGGHHGHVRTTNEPMLQRIASRHGLSPHELCLIWLLHSSPAMIPIPGASRVESARSSARAAAVELPVADLEELDRAFLPRR